MRAAAPAARTSASAGRPARAAAPARTPRGARARIGADRSPARPRVGGRLDAVTQRRLSQARVGNPLTRVRVLSIAVIATLALFSGRLVYVQAYQGETLAAQALEGRMNTTTIPAVRGEITDADGNVLATSVTRYDVFADQVLIADWTHTVDGARVGGPVEAARLLAPIFGEPEAELAAKLSGTSKYKMLERDMAPETWDAIKELGISGMFAEQAPRRSYPAGTTGGNLIGFVGAEGTGMAGLEYALDEQLAGVAGSRTYERGLGGHAIPTGVQSSKAAVPGTDVRTTLRMDLQWKAQAAIDAQVAKMGASGGFVVVMDVKTGEIYALADSGAMDPNKPTGFGGSKAISTIFDPGSTAKIVTMAAALETGVATPTSQYTVPYNYTTSNGQTFKDSHEHGDEPWTLTGILAESSNTGTVMVGEQIPKQVRHDYLTKFGFGEKTGIELAGEERGLLADADAWDGRTQYTVLFGQGMAATALQATNVFATMANGGVRNTPHLVAGTTGADGVYTPSPLADPVQAVSPETAGTVLKMMESAVLEGTGENAEIAGYRVAGKTGTAQIPGADGKLDAYLASFVGVAPVDDPRLAVGVFIENPTATEYAKFGGVSAAPVFSDVTSFALQQLGVVPSGSTPELYPTTW
ncbi:peptidoglycan D,D-transpeptidase FtsI family protein [Sanguibacter sp. Leaf3]|uniref:peptidoglycan D,D-transpeptidase FtsI family protein n=1 Tax=Sanguibacter sp. Leaf3 TaxID=1736209 RepID=UPI000A8324EF|nr:penicillin-binding protein 2 [Sanguibacter sp. Leaf3]